MHLIRNPTQMRLLASDCDTKWTICICILCFCSNFLIFKIMVGSILEQVLGNKTMQRQVEKTHTFSCRHRSQTPLHKFPTITLRIHRSATTQYCEVAPQTLPVYLSQVLPRRAPRGRPVSVLFQGETRVEIHISQEPHWNRCLHRSNSRFLEVSVIMLR